MRDSLMKSVQMAIEISTKLVQLSSIITDLTIVCVCHFTLSIMMWLYVYPSLVAHNIFSCTTNHSLCQQVYLVMYTSSPYLCSSIERFAQHEAKRTEQKARGELERQKLQNEKEAEAARHVLLKLQAVASAVESSGQAKAEAQAHAQRLLIEGQSAIECE